MGAVGVKWDLHTPWHPESSSKVERGNAKLKKHLTKLQLENGLPWTKNLSLALLRIRTCPRKDTGVSPFEMLMGRPYLAKIGNPIPEFKDLFLRKYLQTLDSGTCIYNGTSYSICKDEGRAKCYDPKGPTHRYTIKIQAGNKVMVNHDFYNPKVSQSITFDACEAMDKGDNGCGSMEWRRKYAKNEKYLCGRTLPSWGNCGYGTFCNGLLWEKCITFRTRGLTALYMNRLRVPDANCPRHKCNPINLTFPIPENWLKPQPWKGYQDEYGLGIDGTGANPSVKLKIQVIKHSLNPIENSLFYSYYQEFQKLQDIVLPPKAQNMFLALAETIAKELTVKNCFVCGGTNMGEQWPWEAQEVNYTYVAESQANYTFKQKGEEIWAITTNLVGNVCYQRNQTTDRTINVGSLRCLGVWENQAWWSGGNIPEPARSLESIVKMDFLKTPEEQKPWTTPDGLYWICGRYAYNILPAKWFGSCILGAIRPSFFLLPLKQRQVLGVPVYEEIGNIREKRGTKDIHKGVWKDAEWPPERIIYYYGPAMWAEEGTYGYRTPIYLLNRLIRLQAVVEIITNETILAMTHLAKESACSRTYIMQNRLALDYLLAKEGGVCGKFNLTNCCIEIDEIAHVPVQTWEGFNMGNLFGSWFPKLPGLQAIVALIGIIAAGCVILPCVLPIFIRTITSTLSLIAKRQVVEQMMVLRQQYDPLENLEESPEEGWKTADLLLTEFESRMEREQGGL
uniref:Integrase catalytic domain-containing protein n=1 Tax=Pseudonaja textilis TaxID=8673 RepID=A0A670Z7X2_PSETE